jgi:tRNA A37 threonylcarbamoyladenosine dehydratase
MPTAREIEDIKKTEEFDELLARLIRDTLKRSGREADIETIVERVRRRVNPRLIEILGG